MAELSADPVILASPGIPRRERKAVPPGIREAWVSVYGRRMRYLTAGQGPPLLFLHGLMGYSFSWSEVLGDLASDFAVYAPDLLNTGWSDRMEQEGTLECAANSVVAFLDAIGLEQADIVGSSHGGTLALLLLATRPERVSRVIAAAPATSWSERRRWQARVFSTRLGGFLGHALPYVAPFVQWYFVSRMYADPKRILPGTIAGYNAPLKVKGTIRYLLNVMRCWSKDFASLDERLASIDDSRLFFLWGEKDLVVRVDCIPELRRRYPQARWIMMADTGHLPYEEHPVEFSRHLRATLLSR